jgi:hypothetical protein
MTSASLLRFEASPVPKCEGPGAPGPFKTSPLIRAKFYD